MLRAGLAGLYMSLSKIHSKKPANLNWTLTDDAVRIEAMDGSLKSFIWIVEQAYQCKEGVLYCPAIHDSTALDARRAHFHAGMIGTFLQHNLVQPRKKGPPRVTQLDDHEYQFNLLYINQKDIKYRRDAAEKLFVQKRGHPFAFANEIHLKGYVLPGAPPRFKHEVSWVGTVAEGLLMLFAPLACSFTEVEPQRGTWCVIVPRILNLKQFMRLHVMQTLSSKNIMAASPADAALLYMVESELSRAHMEYCEVYIIGRVAWNKNQQVRKGVLRVQVDDRRFQLYRKMRHTYFRNRMRAKKNDPTYWVATPLAAARVAENLVQNQRWYRHFAVPTGWHHDALERQRKAHHGGSIQKIWFQSISKFERKELIEFMNSGDDIWEKQEEKWFVEGFHQALSYHYAKEAEYAGRRGGARKIGERFEDLNDKIYRDITHAKTAEQLRKVISEFWARAGRPVAVREHMAELWKFLNADWQHARDLALVSLASFKSASSAFVAAIKEILESDTAQNFVNEVSKAKDQQSAENAFKVLWHELDEDKDTHKEDILSFIKKDWKKALERARKIIEQHAQDNASAAAS
ncbi:MAG: type I-MYXAN CRISPR-associated Cas8a1/Cmx1 [Leptospiraceae bacterium]|nr:type I-MYXAN CRISPR-associated Cas8a1/Cmx1 [Leptospiraceae bacterium]